MQYFVVSNDGQKYGPADVATLNEWIKQDRIRPDSILESVATTERIPAGSVIGLQFEVVSKPLTPEYSQSNAYAQAPTSEALGAKDANTGLILGILGLVLCPLLSFAALYYGKKAKDAGSQNFLAATILGWLGIAATVIGMIFFAVFFIAVLGKAG